VLKAPQARRAVDPARGANLPSPSPWPIVPTS
jgi:hypothetical protein